MSLHKSNQTEQESFSKKSIVCESGLENDHLKKSLFFLSCGGIFVFIIQAFLQTNSSAILKKVKTKIYIA